MERTPEEIELIERNRKHAQFVKDNTGTKVCEKHGIYYKTFLGFGECYKCENEEAPYKFIQNVISRVISIVIFCAIVPAVWFGIGYIIASGILYFIPQYSDFAMIFIFQFAYTMWFATLSYVFDKR